MLWHNMCLQVLGSHVVSAPLPCLLPTVPVASATTLSSKKYLQTTVRPRASDSCARACCPRMQVRTCRQGIVDYFTNFLQLRPFGTIDKCIIRELAPGVAINSGIYTFKLTKDTGGPA